MVDSAGEGSIVFRPAAVYPVEIHTDGRVCEFERENRVLAALHKTVRTFMRRKTSR